MRKQQQGILAVYRYLDDICRVIHLIKDQKDFQGHEVYSPASYHELEHVSGFKASEVRWFTLIGAMTGMFSGFALTLGTDYDWPLVVGGKMAGFYSFPAYIIIAFELAILFGGAATVIGMLVMGGIPDVYAEIMDTRITNDRFVLFVPGIDEYSKQAELLKNHGAEEITFYGKKKEGKHEE